MKSLSNKGAFGMSVFASPIETSPLVTQVRHFRTGMRRLKQDCRTSGSLVKLFRNGVLSLENCCLNNLALKIKFALAPM